jgi:hypothetical protein
LLSAADIFCLQPFGPRTRYFQKAHLLLKARYSARKSLATSPRSQRSIRRCIVYDHGLTTSAFKTRPHCLQCHRNARTKRPKVDLSCRSRHCVRLPSLPFTPSCIGFVSFTNLAQPEIRLARALSRGKCVAIALQLLEERRVFSHPFHFK